MSEATYHQRRGQIETYFDRTAVATWARLTSDAPVGGIRATVRAGRDRMRATLLDWLGTDLSGRRILDAGCGTGALAVEAARRGAEVVAIDLSPTLISLARARLPQDLGPGSIDLRSGDMLDPALGRFDHVVAMDSLIHYDGSDGLSAIAALARRTRQSLLFTFAPSTPALSAMMWVGRCFPRGNRAPMIEPQSERRLRQRLVSDASFSGWETGRSHRVGSGFHIAQAMELARR